MQLHLSTFHDSFSCNHRGFQKWGFLVTSFLTHVFVATDLSNLSYQLLLPCLCPTTLLSTPLYLCHPSLSVSSPSCLLLTIPGLLNYVHEGSQSHLLLRQGPSLVAPSLAVLIVCSISKRICPGYVSSE